MSLLLASILTLLAATAGVVIGLIQRTATAANSRDELNNGANIGKLFEGCAAVLRAMDEITVTNE